MSKPQMLPQTLELLISDINGVPRGKSLTGAAVEERALTNFAKAVLMQTVTGDYAQAMDTFNPKDSDMLLQPDWSSYRASPWLDGVGQVICETLDADTRLPLAYDSRNVLRRIVQRFADQGLQPIVAPELELYLLEPPSRDALQLETACGQDGRAEFGGEAFNPDALGKFQVFIDDLSSMTQQAGLHTSALVHEMGPAQIELNVDHGPALDRADELFLLKRLVKACAVRHGKLASFMAKPIVELPGNGLHLHCSLIDEAGNNVFALQNGEAPQALKHFIGGLQQYLPEAFALLAPHVNSYKRFVPGVSAPINLEWGYDNRTAGLRVPAGDAAAGRVENRVAGADANPYLMIASTLACGLAGMEEGIEPSAAHGGDAYDEVADLPDNLVVALHALGQSSKLRELFGDDFIEVFLSVKHNEYSAFSKQLSPWEVRFLGSAL